jgi:hypothetical protein
MVVQAFVTSKWRAIRLAFPASRDWMATNSAAGCFFKAGICAVVAHQPTPITAHRAVFLIGDTFNAPSPRNRLSFLTLKGDPPKTTFRSWVDGGGSVFGVDGFMMASSVRAFLTFDPSWLMGFRSSWFLIFAVLCCFHFLLIYPELFNRFPKAPISCDWFDWFDWFDW